MTTCAQALKAWEEKNGKKAAEAVEVKLCANIPSIIKMDNSLGNLVNCEQLSLSTNSIDRIAGLNGNMAKLRILSLGRNGIKKIEKLDDIAGTLEQLWISYNDISSLDGLMNLTKLNTLYCARNNIKSFSELGKLANIEGLKDVVFAGNPMYETRTPDEIRIEILKNLPQVSKIDGELVKPCEREAARGSSERPESTV